MIRRHLRVTRAVWTQAIRRDAQFRAQAWATGVVGIAELAVGLVPVLLIGRHGAVNGWSPGQLIAVTGWFQITMGVIGVVVAPNLTKISSYVKEGDLDGVLVRPVDPQWFTTFRWVQPAAGTGLLGGIALVIVGLWNTDLHVLGLLQAIGWLACGCALVTMLWANLAYLAFWFESADFIHELVTESLTAGRYPVAFFPSAVRSVLTFVVPIGVATTLPVQAMTGTVPWTTAVGVLLTVIIAAVITRLHWTIALRRYASASS